MTATVAVVAGGGLALAFHESPARPAKDCGLVPCAVALPAAVRSSGSGPAGEPAPTAPPAGQHTSTPPAPPATAPGATSPVSAEPVSAPDPFWSSAPVASSAGQAVSPDRAVGVSYEITQDSQHGIHGQIVIANESSAAVRGWRVTVVLPGDAGYRVLNARNRSAGDALVMSAPAAGPALAAGGTVLIAFTARGTTSTPVRATFADSARPGPSGGGSATGAGSATGSAASRAAGGQPDPGYRSHDGWSGGWLGGGLSGGGRSGGWPDGGWFGRGGAGYGWTPGGRAEQQDGWPGGR